MKKRSLLFAIFVLSSLLAQAGDSPFKQGERLRLQAAEPLQDGAAVAMTVVQVGPGPWILVEYDRTFTTPGESGVKSEKAQMWVNTAQLISAKVLPAK